MNTPHDHRISPPRRSDCPISFGLDLFGDKWTLLVLRDLLLFGRSRYREFAANEHIATNILADRLSRLESSGLITKTRDTEHKNQFIYAATPTGASLTPVIAELMFWGFAHDENSPVSPEYRSRLRCEPERVRQEVYQAISDGTFTQYRKVHMGIAGGDRTS